MSYTQIAKKLKVTEAAIRKKIKKLEENGIITCYTVELNRKKLGKTISAIIGIDTKPDKLIYIIQKLKKDKEITRLFSTTGDHMILFEINFAEMDNLYKFVEKLENIKGITKICPAIILKQIK